MKVKTKRTALGWTCLVFLLPGTDLRAALPPLIPRAALFGGPDKLAPTLSPDGTRVAYLAPLAGVPNVWVRTIGKKDDRPVTRDDNRGIQSYFWASDNTHILCIQDREGKGGGHLYAINPETSQERDLTPFEGAHARVVALDRWFPNEVLVAINKEDPSVHDIFRCNVTTGALTPEAPNRRGFADWVADGEFRIRAAVRPNAWGGAVLFVRGTGHSQWRRLIKWRPEDAHGSRPLGFTPDGKGLYINSSAGTDTVQIRKVAIDTGDETVLAHDDDSDVAGIVVHPEHKTIQAVAFLKKRRVWKVLDQSIADDFATIRKIHRGDFVVVNRDHADRIWLVSFEVDDGPTAYYAYDRKTRKAEFLFTDRKAPDGARLARMKPIEFKARDGLTLHGYLTTPPGVPPVTLPTVLMVHDGPWQRDTWGYRAEVQWLANRGYAVLQVNYRGSTGYGKRFVDAGKREWGGKMQDDLVDAVGWVVKGGVADPKRIAIYGRSYGGYAVLVGLTDTPDLFACGVEAFGPSNLITLLKAIPPQWKPLQLMFFDRVGDPERDAELLQSRSPLFKADRITRPLLIAQGANDPQVKQSETRQIVEAIKKNGKAAEYVEYDNEGHGFSQPENLLDFHARAERFLATHLGGRYEPAEPPLPTSDPEKVD